MNIYALSSTGTQPQEFHPSGTSLPPGRKRPQNATMFATHFTSIGLAGNQPSHTEFTGYACGTGVSRTNASARFDQSASIAIPNPLPERST